MNDLKISLISHEYPPYTIGGIGTHCHDLATSLARKGVDTTVFCGKSDQISIDKTIENLTVERLPFIGAPPQFVWFQYKNYKYVVNKMRDTSIIHGINPLSSSIWASLKSKIKKPFITTIHESDLTDMQVFLNSPFSEWGMGDQIMNMFGYPLYNLLTRNCLNHSDHIVACGKTTLNDIQNVYTKYDYSKSTVIYNGINMDKLDKINVDEESDDRKIMFFGRLVWRKGIFQLISSMSQIMDNHPDYHLDVYGKGPLESKILDLISSLKLEDNISLKGFVSYTELISSIKRSSLVVLPSYYEVGPFISALEAMYCKKPVVLFDRSFAKEFITHNQNGLLVKTGDINSLAENIDILISDDKKRRKMGEAAYNYVKKHHDWNNLVDDYISLYNKIIE